MWTCIFTPTHAYTHAHNKQLDGNTQIPAYIAGATVAKKLLRCVRCVWGCCGMGVGDLVSRLGACGEPRPRLTVEIKTHQTKTHREYYGGGHREEL